MMEIPILLMRHHFIMTALEFLAAIMNLLRKLFWKKKSQLLRRVMHL